VEREAGAGGPGAARVLAREHAAGQGAVAKQAHRLASTHLCELVLEAAVQQAEVVLDGLVACEPAAIRRPQALHQTVGALVAAAGVADLALLDEAREAVERLLVGHARLRPPGLA